MNKFWKFLIITPVLLSLGACIPSQMRSGATPMRVQPVMPVQQGMLSNTMYHQASPQIMNELASMRERVRRTERAMIRLDKRMQLLERNELARISSLGMGGEKTSDVSGSFQPMSFSPTAINTTQAAALTAPQRQVRTNSQPQISPFTKSIINNTNRGFQPVALGRGGVLGATNTPDVITSSLQPAPKLQNRLNSSARSGFSNLPSLADNRGKKKVEDKSIAVWAIKYEPNKIWPSRNQLISSREVIEVLRSDKSVALFARGSNTSSREFRERVRAVSKYLGKVANVTNVPISSMPAEHLGGDTIEIMVAR